MTFNLVMKEVIFSSIFIYFVCLFMSRHGIFNLCVKGVYCV